MSKRRDTVVRAGLPLLIFAAALTACQPPRARSPVPKVGEPLREIAEPYLAGIGPRSLAEAEGQVVVLEFWATYCEPCKRSFPAYEELHRQPGVAVIAVSLDEREAGAEESIKAFADQAGATFGILWDADQSSLDTYGLRKMPTAFIIDQRGVLRHIHGGYEAATAAAIERDVAALLAEAP